MRIVSTSYINTAEYNDPEKWLDRISFHTIVLEQLAKRHTIISIEQINYEGDLHQNGVHYHFYDSKKKRLLFPFRLHRYIRKTNPDIVIVNGLIFPLQLIQLKWIMGNKIKIIGLHHAEKPFKGIKTYLQKLSDRFISAYLFSSFDTGMAWVKRGIIKNSNKIVEVMEGSSSFQPMNRNDAIPKTKVEGRPVYLWVGRLNANKDPLMVVKAFLQFSKIYPETRLYMIYQNEDLLNEVKDLISSANVNDKTVILVGKIAHSQLQAWYNSADFVISGSHYEGSGIAICEAMSCGCVPVLTNINSFRTMTGHGKCGLLYEKANVDDLLAALTKTIKFDVNTEREKTLQQYKIALSPEAIAEKINTVIEKI
jgi:glycosyltransferase involved in cell wall biosynthesis